MSNHFSIGRSGASDSADNSRRKSVQSDFDLSFESVLSERINTLSKAETIKISGDVPPAYAKLNDQINEIIQAATQEQAKKQNGFVPQHHIKINQPDIDGFIKDKSSI